MASYDLRIKPSAVKELKALSKPNRQRIVEWVLRLASEPRPHGAEKLTGQARLRIRQGDYRILYSVDDESREVTVVKIGHRGDVYR